MASLCCNFPLQIKPEDTLSSVLCCLSQTLNLLKIHPSRSVVCDIFSVATILCWQYSWLVTLSERKHLLLEKYFSETRMENNSSDHNRKCSIEVKKYLLNLLFYIYILLIVTLWGPLIFEFLLDSTEFTISGYKEPGQANLTVLLILSVVLILLLTCLLGLVTTIINSHLLSKEIRTQKTRSNTTQNFQENSILSIWTNKQ